MNGKEQFQAVEDGLLIRAPAKINLSLLVAGKRPDGFHELETIMAKITYYDEILVESDPEGSIELACEGPEWAPQGPDNLVYRAAELFVGACGSNGGIKLTLTKNIPAGSGLGGGSSDAAATLLGLNRYLKVNLPREELAKIACELGSDVPFFLGGPAALCKGRGEKIEELRERFHFLALLLLPYLSVSTEKVYANYIHNTKLFEELSSTIRGYIAKNRIDSAAKMCANMLEISCFGLKSELAELKAQVEALAAAKCCLSGSGSAMFCIVDDADVGKAISLSKIIQAETGCKSIIVTDNSW